MEGFKIGEHLVYPHLNTVKVNGRDGVNIEPKAMDVLVYLAKHADGVVPKERIMQAVWPDLFVTDDVLTHAISHLRKCLGEDARSSRLIQTVPKKGYRLIGPVSPLDTAIEPGPSSVPVLRSKGSRRAVVILVLVILLVGAAGLWFSARSGPKTQPVALMEKPLTSYPDAPDPREIRLEAVPFTSYTGREAEPTFSPDGSLVAFTWDGKNQDNPDIYVKAIGAEQPLRLTSDRARDGSPAWSPDGTRIAFLRDKPGGGSEVRLIPPTGRPERAIGEVEGLADQGLSWSPDSRSLAVVDRSSPGEPLGIFVLDIVSGVRKRLTPPSTFADILPAFSPDGGNLAFNRTPLGRDPLVHVVPVAGGEPRELAPTRFPRPRLAWIPGGKEILFAAVPVAHDGGQPRPSSAGTVSTCLWRVPVDGGQARLIAGSENAGDVAVSTDGHRLVYSQGTIDWDIWRLDLRRRAATGDAQTRFIASTTIDDNPQFSPNGERVVFTSHRSGQPEIWVVDRLGRDPRQLTSFGRAGVVGSPRWSPDGKTIAFDFAAKGGNNVDIYVISALGGPPRRVTTSPAIDAMPSWSKDGRFIYFGSRRDGQCQVWKVPSSGEEAGNAWQVTRGGGFAAIESKDGRHVYFTRKLSWFERQNSLWRIPVEGGDEEVVVEEYRSSVGSWDLTDEGLYFVDQESSSSGTSWVVRFQGFDRRHATEVARLRHPPFLGGPAVSVSSDGRWMLSTQSQGGSDLMLVETFR